MRLAPVVLVASSLLLACPSFAADDLTVAKYDLSVTERIRTANGKMIEEKHSAMIFRAPDGHERIEDSRDGQAPYRIRLKLPGRDTYVLNPAEKTFYLEPPAIGHLEPMRVLSRKQMKEQQKRMKFLGSKSIQGLTCSGSRNKNGGVYWEVWQCQDPALGPHAILWADQIMRKQDGTGWKQRLIGVTEGVRVSEGFFKTPSDFRSVEAPKQNLLYPQEIPNPYDVPVYAGPIPNPFDVQVYAGPIPNWHGSGQQDEYPHPIPNWHGPGGESRVYSIPLKPCGIFEKKGKAYRYVAGEVPREVWRGKQKWYSSNDIKKIADGVAWS